MILTLYKFSKHPLYDRWINIKQRCLNQNNTDYHSYGGRGITICDEWRYDFFNFYRWCISNGYEPNLRIDRRDNDGNYEPSNCHFVTEEVNQNNKRSNVFFTYNNQQLTLPQIQRLTGIEYRTLWHRVSRQGLTIDEAVAAGRKVVYRHKESMMKRCEALGVPYNAMRLRKVKYGLTEAEAMAYYINKQNNS